MSSYIPRRRGGQPGNQNARKHGYYSNALFGPAKANLNQAFDIIGLDEEIALLRARLKDVVQNDPTNLRLISEAASTLARLMRTSHKLGFAKAEKFEEARFRALWRLGPELGFDPEQVIAHFLGNHQSSQEDNRLPPK